MRQAIVDFLRSPEWVAAVALLIQAAILLLQWRTLGRHAVTMERHTEVAEAQARTADLIGKAVQQQGAILAEQTKIMDGQLSLQKRIEEQAERERVFAVVFDMRTELRRMSMVVAKTQLSAVTPERRQLIDNCFVELQNTVGPALKALMTSIHITKEEKDYYSNFALAVDKLKLTNDLNKDSQAIMDLENKYKDFGGMLNKLAQSTPSVVRV